ncbi:MAG: MoaD/ThiS family protein [Fusobacteriaceae bacterium]
MIHVKLFATLRQNLGKEKELDFKEGLLIRNVLDNLQIPCEHVAIILVNGQHKTPEDILSDDDTVSFFPPVAGG